MNGFGHFPPAHARSKSTQTCGWGPVSVWPARSGAGDTGKTACQTGGKGRSAELPGCESAAKVPPMNRRINHLGDNRHEHHAIPHGPTISPLPAQRGASRVWAAQALGPAYAYRYPLIQPQPLVGRPEGPRLQTFG